MESEMEAMSGETDSDDDFRNMIESDGSARSRAPVYDQLPMLLILVIYQLPDLRFGVFGFTRNYDSASHKTLLQRARPVV